MYNQILNCFHTLFSVDIGLEIYTFLKVEILLNRWSLWIWIFLFL